MKLNKKKEKISRMILSYLQKNSCAGDTLEGITRWWLGIERIETSVNDVSDALKSLIRKGLIRVYKTKGGTSYYKINDD